MVDDHELDVLGAAAVEAPRVPGQVGDDVLDGGAGRLARQAHAASWRASFLGQGLHPVDQGLLPVGPLQEGVPRAGGGQELPQAQDVVGAQVELAHQPGGQAGRGLQLFRGGRLLVEVALQADVHPRAGPVRLHLHHFLQLAGLEDVASLVHEEVVGDARVAPLHVGLGDHLQGHDGGRAGVVDHQEADLAQGAAVVGLLSSGQLSAHVRDGGRARLGPGRGLAGRARGWGWGRRGLGRGRGRLLPHRLAGLLRFRGVHCEPAGEHRGVLVPEPGLALVDQVDLQGVVSRLRGQGDAGVEGDRLSRGHVLGQGGVDLPLRGHGHSLFVLHVVVGQAHRVASALGPGDVADVLHRDGHGDLRPREERLGQLALEPLGSVGRPARLTGGRGLGRLAGLAGCRLRHGFPPVIVLQGLPEIVDDPLFALDVPLVDLGPAVEDQGADLLVPRLLVPPVDLPVGVADPAGVLVAPGHVLVRLGDVDGQVAHVLGHRVHEVPVRLEVVEVLGEGLHLALVVDQVGVAAVAVGVDGDPITAPGPQGQEDVLEVLDPVPSGVARVGGLDVPGGHCADEHLIVLVAGHAVDGVPAEGVAAGVHGWGDHLAAAHAAGPQLAPHLPSRAALFLLADGAETLGQAPQPGIRLLRVPAGGAQRPHAAGARPLHRVVHLVADDPDLAARAGRHVVGAAPGEVLVLAAVGDGAFWVVAVVQAAHDAQVAVAEGAKIFAAAVVGVVADGLGEEDPTGLARLQHVTLAAGFVDAEDVLRIEQRAGHGTSVAQVGWCGSPRGSRSDV